MLYHNNSRKGLSRNLLFYIITTLVAFLVILLVIKFVWDKADSNVSESACRASVLSRAKRILELEWFGGTVKSSPILPLRCQTQDKPNMEGNKDAVMEQISYMSARCWWMFLNGEYQNIFGRADFLSNKKCFTCYTFTIKSDVEITAEDLEEYMASHYYIETDDKKITYLEYIQSYKGDGAVLIGKENNEKISITGKKEETYSINLLSPDLTKLGDIINHIVSIFSGHDTGKKMNRIYIDKLDNQFAECVELESI